MKQIIIAVSVLFHFTLGVWASDPTPHASTASSVVDHVKCAQLLLEVLGDDLDFESADNVELEQQVKLLELTLSTLKQAIVDPSFDPKTDKQSDDLTADRKGHDNKRFELIVRIMQLRLENSLRVYRNDWENEERSDSADKKMAEGMRKKGK